MKRELMNILVCPICKGDLILEIKEENEKEIISGTLFCSQCDDYYLIKNEIPEMLPPNLRG